VGFSVGQMEARRRKFGLYVRPPLEVALHAMLQSVQVYAASLYGLIPGLTIMRLGQPFLGF
jgi:hypothetical protein